jgi:hypothetical protein
MDGSPILAAGAAGAGAALLWTTSKIMAQPRAAVLVALGRLLEQTRANGHHLCSWALSGLLGLLGCAPCLSVWTGWTFGLLLGCGWGTLAAGPIAYLLIAFLPREPDDH